MLGLRTMNRILLCISILFLASRVVLSQNIDLAISRMDSFDLQVETFLVVSISEQRLYAVKNKSVNKSFPISTSKFGVGNQQGSYKTPLGMHKIKEKIGEKVPFGGILEERVYIGKIAKIYTDSTDVLEDVVLTRIMWLEGIENGFNKGEGIDSFRRYIYIHGTNEEGLIGNPASHGCIRMKNLDAIKLFNLVSEGTYVFIQE